LRGVKLLLNGNIQLPKNNVLFKVFSLYFSTRFYFFSIPVFAPGARQINPAQEQREFLMTQRQVCLLWCQSRLPDSGIGHNEPAIVPWAMGTVLLR
jgi:hypothetical protein